SRTTAGSDWTCSRSTMREWESPDYEPRLPVSEKSNPLTRDIDRASAGCIVRMLQACDAQMFQEETGATYQRLLSDRVVQTVMEVARRVEVVLKEPQGGLVVLSGCGTSGRLAFLTSGFNRELRTRDHSSLFSYIVAGGDRSLLSSQEAPEDDANLGILSLKKACEGKTRVLFIGISCGLSAPFVAGQLDFCLQHPEVYTPVLLGFNPPHQASDEPIPGCTFTFHSVVQRMQELVRREEAFLITPAVGPEAVSGSSRMKGGSATKILLDVILSAAHAATFTNTPITYKYAWRCEKKPTHSLISTIFSFSCDYEDVRGFTRGGYSELNNNEGPLTSLGSQFCIAHQDFLRFVLPTLSDQDTVLLIYTQDDVSDVVTLARRVRGKTSNLHAVHHHTDEHAAAAAQQVSVFLSFSISIHPPVGLLVHMQRELSTKLLLNAVSTGAHILKGKIYQNHMIDVQVTNSKLYRRATRLLQKLSAHPEHRCEEALLKAIHRVDELTADISSSDVTTHAHASDQLLYIFFKPSKAESLIEIIVNILDNPLSWWDDSFSRKLL
uniref:SIS domain-containing protein n=1 Tax=Scophthalmus maximus TaxID=52904 RepID=A0A8D2ZH62_SCOMX